MPAETTNAPQPSLRGAQRRGNPGPPHRLGKTLATVAALAAALAACSPSPQGVQPADPLAGAGSVELRLGGCSVATSQCQP